VIQNDICVLFVAKDLTTPLILRDTLVLIQVFVPTNAISVRSHSLNAVHWSHTALKFTEWLTTMNTSKEDQRCMFVKIVVTPPRNLNYTTFTWKKNIPTVRLYWNSMTKDISSSTIPALPACCSKSIRSRFKKLLKTKLTFALVFSVFPPLSFG